VSGSDLDARLRRHFAGTDTTPGFEARVLARVSALPVLPVDQLRLLYERRDFEERARLRRSAWLNVATAFGVGAAAIALVWREGPAVAHWMNALLATSRDAGGMLTAVAFMAAGLGVWAALGRTAGRL
jgi:hypothetical protein